MIEILDPRVDAERIAQLNHRTSGYHLVDAWEAAIAELREIDERPEPHGRGAAGTHTSAPSDRFVVFDWRRTVVRIPDPESFWRLRTTRNRYLIDDTEQRAWAQAVVGVAGLSVGASALAVCSLTGARRFRVADHDTLSITNLNRLPASVCDLGVAKTTIAHRRVLEIDPYSDVGTFVEGYTTDNADAFLGIDDGSDRLTVLIEEMDDLAGKIDIRRRARAARVPVLMATDNGDNVIIDVERYDLDPQYPLFHGLAGDLTDLVDTDALDADPRVRARIASSVVGSAVSPRLRYSLTQVGHSLLSWPQLGTAAAAAGAVAAFAARRIATGASLPSGRYRVDVDKILAGEAADSVEAWNELDEEAFLTAMRLLG